MNACPPASTKRLLDQIEEGPVSPQQLTTPTPMPTSDARTQAIECAAEPLLLPQVIAWAKDAAQSDRPGLDTTVKELFLNAATHAHGPIRLVLIQHTNGSLDLAVMDHGPRNDTSPTPTPCGGLAKVEQIAEWGWYGDHRGHTVWARLPLHTKETHSE